MEPLCQAGDVCAGRIEAETQTGRAGLNEAAGARRSGVGRGQASRNRGAWPSVEISRRDKRKEVKGREKGGRRREGEKKRKKMSQGRLATTLLQGQVFVPALVFVNDMIVGVSAVTGDTHVGAVCAKPATKSWILANRMSSRIHNGELQRGDVVVVSDPYNPKRTLVRQIARCGKAWVRVQDGNGAAYHVCIQEGYCWWEGRGEDDEAG